MKNDSERAGTPAVAVQRIVRHRRVHLPNFLPSALPVCAMIIIGNLDNKPADALIVAWFGIIMLGLLALTGLADIMANHYRGKLTMPNVES